ncbi:MULTISPECIES: biotin-independent malonate decarboxylase subunit beta [Oxalobacteraceae]|uniref:biotin-independent malonate decarboxylase subunit beta n=1 Tax=Herminiimonas sp. Marseille-P9896 TaxID=2742211 RepID=UPI00158C645F|nr:MULTISPECIES: biotin-independent malonate decarboxylase subunit beta [Oxalobacteraceae]
MSGAHKSFLERTARQRIADLLDAGSFAEILPPAERHFSPHLPVLGQPVAFDDGIVIGSGLLSGAKVLIAAQEPAFMGGSVGEIHGAKLTGLLERAVEQRPAAVLLLLDTGGVRLHEANAGLIAISEIQRAVFEVRNAGIPVIVMIGGSNGCYGGIGIVAKCCDHMIISEEGRLSVSGPEVIEAAKGVEEFDARDRALVWRTMGGKHRYLMGDADLIVPDDIAAFRDAAVSLLGVSRPLTLESVTQEHAALKNRMERFSDCADATQIWQALGVADAKNVPLAEIPEFLEMSAHVRREEHA